MTGGGTKEERSGRTRQILADGARRLFGEQGYADTGTEDIVRQVGVTRGALYRHFVDKRDLSEAVCVDLQDELRDRILAAVGPPESDSIWVRIHRGTHEYLDPCMDATAQRVVLIDAPSVRGWSRWREFDADYALGLLWRARVGLARRASLPELPIPTCWHA
jgi:AcrR family transcriptional regulator